MSEPKRKHQVFVSSTYEDLLKERREVMHALLELDCIPAGMELFPAADEDQWSLITGVIDECDYYVLILGGRYGSIGPDGMGYTEKEYRYAIETQKPTIAFLHKDPGSLAKRNTEATAEGQARLDGFRELVQKKVCKFWDTPEQLGSVVSRGLIALQKKHPSSGWIRGDVVTSAEQNQELLALRKRIDELETELARASTTAPPGSEALAQGDDKLAFEAHITCVNQDDDYGTWKLPCSTTWNEIFATLAPEMIDEASEGGIRLRLDSLLSTIALRRFEGLDDTEGYRLTDFGGAKIQGLAELFSTVKVQLRALGLIAQSDRKNRSVKNTATYWTLTPYGDSLMNRLRAIRREAPL